jgi:hypothetical protein
MAGEGSKQALREDSACLTRLWPRSRFPVEFKAVTWAYRSPGLDLRTRQVPPHVRTVRTWADRLGRLRAVPGSNGANDGQPPPMVFVQFRGSVNEIRRAQVLPVASSGPVTAPQVKGRFRRLGPSRGRDLRRALHPLRPVLRSRARSASAAPAAGNVAIRAPSRIPSASRSVTRDGAAVRTPARDPGTARFPGRRSPPLR